MPRTSTNVATRTALLAAIIFSTAVPGLAQAPTDAQRDAIRSACRSDYETHCASIQPGGAAALQCLQDNMSALSPPCQSAVRAAEPAEPKAESAPATPKVKSAPAASKADTAPTAPGAAPAPGAATAAAPKSKTMPTATQPTSAEVAAIRGACRSDYPKVCAGVPSGGAPAVQCLDRNKAKLSPACAKAVSAASGSAPAPAAATGAAPAAAPAGPTAIVLRPLRPREELLIARSACGGDVRTLCAGVPPGGGRVAQCLASRAGSLSPACKDVLAPFAAR